MPFLQWSSAWAVFILLLVVIARTKAGNTIVYYLLWLLVVYLLVSHAGEITSMFAGAGIVPTQQGGQ